MFFPDVPSVSELREIAKKLREPDDDHSLPQFLRDMYAYEAERQADSIEQFLRIPCVNEGRHPFQEFCADCGYSRARQEDEEYAAEHAAEDTSGD